MSIAKQRYIQYASINIYLCFLTWNSVQNVAYIVYLRHWNGNVISFMYHYWFDFWCNQWQIYCKHDNISILIYVHGLVYANLTHVIQDYLTGTGSQLCDSLYCILDKKVE